MSRTGELCDYLPPECVPLIDKWIGDYGVECLIVSTRKTKRGDCRHNRRTGQVIITLNADNNKYRFLLTLIHELAHARVFRESGFAGKPHGTPWKNVLRQMVFEVKALGVFPYDVEVAIERHFRDPLYTDSADYILSNILKQYGSATDSL